jgi:hypothetical protein
MNVTDSLDDILARKPAEAETPQEQTTETPAVETPQAEASTEAPAEAPAQSAPEGQQNQKMVPHEALHAEKQKVKRYTEEVADFRKSNEALQKQVAELLQRVPVQQQAQQPQADWYAEPSTAFQQSFQQSIDPMLSPVKQQLQMVTGLLHKMQAKSALGDQYDSFMEFVKENANDPEVVALSAAMETAPDPFAYAKQWFDKKTFDPEAERQKIRAQIEEEMKSPQTPQPATVMPTQLSAARSVGSRSGPQWGGPPSLSDIFKR